MLQQGDFAIKNQIEISQLLTPLDWIVFFLALLITLLAVIWGHYRKKQGNSLLDHILMGRQLTLPMFTATLVATWYGGIFGVTRIAFEQGIYNFITQGFFWYLTYLIFAFFLVKKIAPYQALTLPELIGKMFGKKSAYLSAIFNFFNVLPIVYVISIGIFLQLIFQKDLSLMMICGTGIVLLYSSFGGFRAIVFSDIIQFFIMCMGVMLILIFSIYHFGGLSFLKQQLPPSYFHLTGQEGLASTLSWGLIALATLINPGFYQRVFAAQSTRIAKRGILISIFVWIIFDLCTTFGAMYAKAVIPSANSQYAYLTYAVQLLPTGLRGFVLAGIAATILSTLDSCLFLAGTTLSYDLAPSRLKNKIFLHHIYLIGVGILAIGLANYFTSNIKMVWKTLGSYFAACLLLPVIAGHLFPGKIKDEQFVFAAICGAITTTLWRATKPWPIEELYIGTLATGLALLLWRFIAKIRT